MKHQISIFAAVFTALFLAGCTETKVQLVLSPSSIELFHDKKQTLIVTGAGQNIEWETTNDFIAQVENGEVTGNHVGECAVSVKSNGDIATCNVVVKPKYFTYKEPVLEWGITLEQLKAQKGEYNDHSQNKGKDLYYYVQDKENGIIELYTFADDVLENCSVMLNVKNTDVTDFLIERYQPISYDEETGLALFINSMELEMATLGVGLRPVVSGSTAMFLVTYLPYSDSKSPSMAPTRISATENYCLEFVEKYFLERK